MRVTVTVRRPAPVCRVTGCRGQIVLTDTLSGFVACCLLCGREPGAFARAATPADLARVARDALIHRRKHHRQLMPVMIGGGA
jgi:hypothetical protein